jgi:tetratricopeptide (TPR) repeat protein
MGLHWTLRMIGRLATHTERQNGCSMLFLLMLLTVFLCYPAWAQSSDPRQLFQDAVASQERGDQALAVHEYQQLLRLRPDLIAARVNMAGALISLGQLDEGVAQHRDAFLQAPDNRELALALAYLKKGDVDQAAGLLRSLHMSQPEDVEVATLLGDCDLRLGRDAEAVSLLAPLEKANPGNLYLEWVLGSALIRAGQTYEGVQRVEMVAQQTHSAETYVVAAEANLNIRRFSQARQDVDAARRLNPQLAGLDTLDGTIMESEGDLKGATAMFQKVLETKPNDFQAHLHVGTILYTERQLAAAKFHLERAVEISPKSSPARFQLARVERAQGQMAAAVRDFEQVARSDPDWLPPHIELSALYYQLNRPQDGARERQVVDRLRAEELQRDSKSHMIISHLPSP